MTNVLDKTDIKYETKGQRLAYILDVVGFWSGRGRMSEFHSFLIKNNPDKLQNLKYSTVKAWFGDNAPSMDKISLIIDSINENYKFTHKLDLNLVKNWWKIGGYFPFQPAKDSNKKSACNDGIDLVQAIKKVDSVYVGQVHLLIYQTASELGINLTHDIKRDVLEHVFSKVVFHCQSNNIEIDSPELRELIVSILRLAKEDLL
ncbi:MAG: hypothetical protein QM504_14280 [Pseudomonadota bacterium]